MYAQHFGLGQDPFSIAPDPRFLFMSGRHREALAHLTFGVANPQSPTGQTSGGFVLLTGDIGTGKTTICRCFLAQLPQGCQVAYIFNPKLSVLELLQSIGEEFHITPPSHAGAEPSAKAHIDALNVFLLRSHAAGHSCVLIIDEAQNLQADVLEQLRLLTNLETNERKLLQIVLIGQPELRTMLNRPELEQLAQRVVARFHLDALTGAETAQYIAHRLAVAGHSGPPPFDGQAIRRIHHLARGVPRRINLLCGRALLGAWAQGLAQVNTTVVNKAAAEVWGHAAPTWQWAWPGVGRQWVGTAWGGGGLLAVVMLAAGAWAWWAGALPGPRPAALQAAGHTAAQPAPLGVAGAAGAVVPVTPLAPMAPMTPTAPPEDLDTLLPQLPQNMDVAWHELGPHFGLKTPPTARQRPCDVAAQAGWPCYTAGQLSATLLKQLNRPGVLALHLGNGPPAYATLVGLNEQQAVLSLNGKTHTVPWAQLAALWRGDWATHWRPPPGYTHRLENGAQGTTIEWLVAQLNALEGTQPPAATTQPPRLDSALRERVRAFQRAHGLTPDGRPGAMTFMHIDNAMGSTAPRLHKAPH